MRPKIIGPHIFQVPSIQQTAALSLGRLANHNELIAQAVVNNNILPTLVISLSDQNVSKSPLIEPHNL